MVGDGAARARPAGRSRRRGSTPDTPRRAARASSTSTIDACSTRRRRMPACRDAADGVAPRAPGRADQQAAADRRTRILDALGCARYFDDGDRRRRPAWRKPDPAGLRALGRDGAPTLMVGDSPIDCGDGSTPRDARLRGRATASARPDSTRAAGHAVRAERPADLAACFDRFRCRSRRGQAVTASVLDSDRAVAGANPERLAAGAERRLERCAAALRDPRPSRDSLRHGRVAGAHGPVARFGVELRVERARQRERDRAVGGLHVPVLGSSRCRVRPRAGSIRPTVRARSTVGLASRPMLPSSVSRSSLPSMRVHPDGAVARADDDLAATRGDARTLPSLVVSVILPFTSSTVIDPSPLLAVSWLWRGSATRSRAVGLKWIADLNAVEVAARWAASP